MAALVACLAASLVTIVAPAGAAPIEAERYGGSDRYHTAALAALDTFPAGSNNIILASGENYPDGLAAAVLSGALNAPVLLTARDSLPPSTAAAIGTLDGGVGGPATVHVIGGTAAIGNAVRSSLTSMGLTVNPIGGASRYETAANVASAARDAAGVGVFGGKRTAIVTTGENYPDALSAGSLAQARDIPILLTQSSTLTPATSAALTNLAIQQVIILGGTAAVSPATQAAIEAKGVSVLRRSGPNRYATAASLAELLWTPVASGGAGWPEVVSDPAQQPAIVLAKGTNFPDALAASQVAGVWQAPIILTGSLPAESAAAIGSRAGQIAKFFVMGGTGAIDEATVNAAVAAATGSAPTATITALDGRHTVTVTFSGQVINSLVPGNYRRNNTVGPLAVRLGPAGSNTVTLEFMTPNMPNDVITVNPAGGTVAGAASGGLVALTNYSVVADTTKPTPMVIRGFVSMGSAWILFDEPVSNLAGAGAVTISGAGAPATTSVGSIGPEPARAWLVGLAVPGPAGGNTMTVNAGAFADASAAANTNAVASAPVTTDAAGPAVTSAQYTVTPSANAGLVVAGGTGTLILGSRPEGIAAGHVGNTWALSRVGGGPAITATVNATTRRIEISAPAGALNATAVVAALDANPVFKGNFAAAVIAPGTVNPPVGPTPLTGGASHVRVVVATSEPVVTNAFAGFWWGHGGLLAPTMLAGVSGGGVDGVGDPDPNVASAALTAPSAGAKVLNYETPSQGPVPSTLVVPAGAIWDLANNGSAPWAGSVTPAS